MDTPDWASKPVTRRKHSAAFKAKLLRLCEQPGASVAAIALEHGVNANLVFKWRRNRLRSGAGVPQRRDLRYCCPYALSKPQRASLPKLGRRWQSAPHQLPPERNAQAPLNWRLLVPGCACAVK